MGKKLNSNDLTGQRTMRSLLAVSLAASLAAFGCTTNQNLGNGTPVRGGGDLRSAPTSGVTSGQERATPPPMTSSYNSASALPRVTPRNASRADRAAAIMAGQQTARRGTYLGVVSPGSGGRGYASDQIAGAGVYQPTNPALLTNPQLTVNSSLTSGPTAAINSGAGGVGGGVGGGAIVAGATVGTTGAAFGTTGAIGAAGTIGATPTVTGAGAGTTATTAAAVVNGGDAPLGSPAVGTGLPVGAFAATTLSPTGAIAGIPSVTAASVGAGRTGGVAPLTATPATLTSGNASGAGANNGTTAVTANANTTTNTTASGNVRIIRGANGRAIITNTNTTGRNQ